MNISSLYRNLAIRQFSVNENFLQINTQITKITHNNVFCFTVCCVQHVSFFPDQAAHQKVTRTPGHAFTMDPRLPSLHQNS